MFGHSPPMYLRSMTATRFHRPAVSKLEENRRAFERVTGPKPESILGF